MQFHPNELFLIFDPHSNVGKQTKAIALDLCSHLNEVDVTHEKLSPTYWKEIVNMLGVQPNELLDHSHPDYKKKVADNSYTMDGWLEVLVQDGHLIKFPIAIYGGMAICCHTPTDIMRLHSKSSETKVLPHLRGNQH
ncbi:MAG: glutaredoxin [Flammeovirgaceae bacterium]|nr:glutaredoxin [Flammeovirgaceae bacterium]